MIEFISRARSAVIAFGATAILCCTPLDQAAIAAKISPIRHVFIIVLENESFASTFGEHSQAPYLAHTLVAKGAQLVHYYGIGHNSLDNYIAMISGQAPNYMTQSDCHSFVDFSGATQDQDGQAIGNGCVYPPNVLTIADELQNAGYTWKSYSEDMGNDPARESASCGHPKLNSQDPTQKAEAATSMRPADQYATRHNPFVYFHSIIDTPVCNSNVVNFGTLKQDLQSIATTANYIFITPNLCDDGHDGGVPGRTCVGGHEPGGLVSADGFLREWVPTILASPAFKQDGLLVITFDEADIDVRYDPATKQYTRREGDPSACCNEKPGPNINSRQTVFGAPDLGPGIIGPGGGRIGAVAISPFIRPGTVSNEPYNHYSLLRTIGDIFGVNHLGYAARKHLKSFGADVFTSRNVR